MHLGMTSVQGGESQRNVAMRQKRTFALQHILLFDYLVGGLSQVAGRFRFC